MDSDRTESKLTTVEIFDPPMCCPGGLCGPAVDPELLKINEALLAVGREFGSRAGVVRHILSQNPAKFMANTDVTALLQSEGVNALPVTMVNGRIISKGRYPSLEELRQAILLV